ncbi:Exopolyphosphatase [Arthrobotrys entomopaga]|nr:Exopolyphosphatase [Arthrobotrys entomopaga]
MSRRMAAITSLQQFLQGAKTAFLAATSAQRNVKLVAGNESADLDSFVSSVLYAYFDSLIHSPYIKKPGPLISPAAEVDRFFSRLSSPPLPFLNIPRSELSLRPEHAHLVSQVSFTLDDVPTLDDIPSTLDPTLTSLTLVDHNVLQPPLSSRFSNQVTGIIDHHVDENKYPDANPRYITTSGSCVSLVTNYFRNAYPTHWESIPAPMHSEIARFALAPILIDTANLTSKVTPIDVVQVTELLERIGDGFDRGEFYRGLQEAKRDLSGLSVNGLLRKDYKQWGGDNGVTLGVSAITRSLAWVVKKAGGVGAFKDELEGYAKEKGVDVAVVMTTDSDSKSGFRRDLLIWGLNDRTKSFAQQFEESAKDKFELGRWPDEEDGMDEGVEEVVEGMKAWTQSSLDLSRKQVAPVLRDVANKL